MHCLDLTVIFGGDIMLPGQSYLPPALPIYHYLANTTGTDLTDLFQTATQRQSHP